jgi:hypothetical protein
MLWFQKLLENWVKYGNQKTKFFHTQAIIHRMGNNGALVRNNIKPLM